MSDDEDYNSEEDLDYVPSDGEQVSEEENSGDEEDLSVLQDGATEGSPAKKKRKTKVQKGGIIQPRRRQGGIQLAGEDVEGTTEELKKKDEKETLEELKRKKELAEQAALEEQGRQKEKEKKRADDLWSSFMSDVKVPPRRPAPSSASCGSTAASAGLGSLSQQVKPASTNGSKQDAAQDKAGKVKITKVFDFAGETIQVTKEVDANSKEALAEQKKQEKISEEAASVTVAGAASTNSLPAALRLGLGGASGLKSDVKRPAPGGGLSSVLSKIGKKAKMGTLDKSKMDWDSFKKKEGIEEDLKIHNKGKHGYTERMAFLNRADQRQFELERDLRLGTSSKR